jgi:hypothetical protein
MTALPIRIIRHSPPCDSSVQDRWVAELEGARVQSTPRRPQPSERLQDTRATAHRLRRRSRSRSLPLSVAKDVSFLSDFTACRVVGHTAAAQPNASMAQSTGIDAQPCGGIPPAPAPGPQKSTGYEAALRAAPPTAGPVLSEARDTVPLIIAPDATEAQAGFLARAGTHGSTTTPWPRPSGWTPIVTGHMDSRKSVGSAAGHCWRSTSSRRSSRECPTARPCWRASPRARRSASPRA